MRAHSSSSAREIEWLTAEESQLLGGWSVNRTVFVKLQQKHPVKLNLCNHQPSGDRTKCNNSTVLVYSCVCVLDLKKKAIKHTEIDLLRSGQFVAALHTLSNWERIKHKRSSNLNETYSNLPFKYQTSLLCVTRKKKKKHHELQLAIPCFDCIHKWVEIYFLFHFPTLFTLSLIRNFGFVTKTLFIVC